MGWTGEHGIADLLDCAASYIDFAKIYAMNALLIPSATLKRIIARYRNAEITCYSGGILFEYAYLKNEIDGLLKHLLGLGFNAMEISENYVTLGDEERRRLIGLCQTNGLSVIYEFGRKNPDDPISLDQLGSLITATLELGVKHIILEQSEITFTASRAPGHPTKAGEPTLV